MVEEGRQGMSEGRREMEEERVEGKEGGRKGGREEGEGKSWSRSAIIRSKAIASSNA